jgi:hypothetical protein
VPNSEPELLYWEPATCDSQGVTPYPYIYRAHWSHGLSYLVIDEPTGLAGSLLPPNAVRASKDKIPRLLQAEEIVDKVKNHTTALNPPSSTPHISTMSEF